VASGYLTVGKNNSALAFTFYGRKDIQDPSRLRSIPTVLWLNGGPGSSSQLGNLQELGPLLIIRDNSVRVVQNNYTWALKYNLLFIDQPIGTGLSYADTQSGSQPFAKSMDCKSIST
jgi:carboxypeptidase C (cathepsin A)